jgi:hypothetical protein
MAAAPIASFPLCAEISFFAVSAEEEPWLAGCAELGSSTAALPDSRGNKFKENMKAGYLSRQLLAENIDVSSLVGKSGN